MGAGIVAEALLVSPSRSLQCPHGYLALHLSPDTASLGLEAAPASRYQWQPNSNQRPGGVSELEFSYPCSVGIGGLWGTCMSSGGSLGLPKWLSVRHERVYLSWKAAPALVKGAGEKDRVKIAGFEGCC